MATSQPKKRGSYHHGNLRDALIDTAFAMIEEDGVEALTIRRIAERVGVTHAAPAHHFADKNELMLALATEGFNRFSAALASVMHIADPLARLSEMGRAYVRFALDHPGAYRLIMGPALSRIQMPVQQPTGVGVSEDRGQAASEGTREMLETTVAEAMAGRRALGGASVSGVAFLAWSAMHGAAMLSLDGMMDCEPSGDPAEEFQQKLEEVISFIEAGIALSASEVPPPST
ncbi:MAG: TetR/AcrR family transcriptional regulator [Spirochaetaceae bacterium]|nr:MAG: TetR/AcrR family transcriptional regulator [Spirochaetaceae bacterium]